MKVLYIGKALIDKKHWGSQLQVQDLTAIDNANSGTKHFHKLCSRHLVFLKRWRSCYWSEFW